MPLHSWPKDNGAGPWVRFTDLGPVWSVEFLQAARVNVLASANADGTIRMWKAESGLRHRKDLRGHNGAVLAISSSRIGSRSIVVSGGIDGTVRFWDPVRGAAVGDPLIGHVGGVRAVRGGTIEGADVVASAGADGTVRLWDTASSSPMQVISGAHNGSALAVAFGEIDGVPFLASAGDDGVIRVWDANNGAEIVALRGHRGGVRSLDFAMVAGRPVLASASDDGTVRMWDPRETQATLEPLLGHTGIVRSVVFTAIGSRVVLASSGIDGTVRLWDPLASSVATVATAILATPVSDTRSITFGVVDNRLAIAVADGQGGSVADLADLLDFDALEFGPLDRSMRVSVDGGSADDVLGRVTLARHLHGVIGQLIGVGEEAGSSLSASSDVVVNIDGRWGAGKTTLARLLEAEMAGENLPKGSVSSTLPRDPVVIRFDAWREAAVAPHWWAISAAINRAVRRERSPVARVAMTLNGAARRIARSPASVAAVLVATFVVLALMFIRGAAPSELNDVLATIQTSLTAAAALVAVAAVGTRSLFWASPALGRLHLRSDDNPLGDVADMVSSLRRWSPRARWVGQLETAVVAGLVLIGVEATRVLTASPELLGLTGGLVQTSFDLVSANVGTIATVTVVALIVAFSMIGRSASTAEAHPAARLPGSLRTWRFPRYVRLAIKLSVLLAVVSGCTWILSLPLPTDPHAAAALLAVLAVLAVALAASLGLAYILLRRRPRRPLLLVIDELDRCEAATVVSYLETIHTVLRNDQTRRRGTRSETAPLVVLALADGRWIRSAFTSHYASFESLGSPVRSLGGDFLQKLFDHTVLIPELTADHVASMLARVTRSESDPRVDGDAIHSSRSKPEILPGPGAVADSARSDPADGALALLSKPQDRDSAAVDPALDVVEPYAVRRREAHLLSAYATILPANPRLIRRVANTWSMLDAIRVHVGHGEPDDVVVRAAVMFVAFPSLVDDLLSSPTAPHLPSRAVEVATARKLPKAWKRPDVLAVLTKPNGTLVQPEAIAQCYGRNFHVGRDDAPGREWR